ncbi:TPA: Poly(A) RNA polymerase cid13 [Trebouxia sp. C0005]
MLQACYPAEVSTSPLSCNDLRIPTSEVEFDLAHRQAQAVSKLYARLNGNTFGVGLTKAVGTFSQVEQPHLPLSASGEPWPGTIRASPSAYASSYQREAEMLDTAALSQRLQALRIRAMASSYLAPARGQGGLHQQGYARNRDEGFAVQTGHPSYHQQSGATSVHSARSSIKSTSKRQAAQKSLGDKVRRTIYICDIDQQVTEEQLANLFQECGRVVDCRVCGDPNSAMRFAFIEFLEESAAKIALTRNGAVLGTYPLRVLPSKTAIVPVNNQYLPRTEEERELCGRTVYAANIDKKVDRTDVQAFFETLCGPVSKIRLLGDYHHPTRIAFIEFNNAESARAALNCSGALLGSTPVRVSPSKTPVRPDPRHDDTPVPRRSVC